MQTKSLNELITQTPSVMRSEVFVEHIAKRGYNRGIPGWICWESQLLYFPLWTATAGRCIGYQRYDWRGEKLRDNGGKYFTWISEGYKPVAAYGWEWYGRPGPLFITEGIWDAIRVINAGYSCIATLGATPSREWRSWFKWYTEGILKIAIKDADKAGEALAKLADVSYTVPSGKDVNEMTPQAAKEFLDAILKG